MDIKKQTRRNFLRNIGLCAASLTATNAIQAATAQKRPNILFILTDDQAAWALGASGNKMAITPNMDRLAHEGAYFPNSFTTTPVCSPSRASLLSGRYGTELGITDWLNHKSKKYPEEANLGLDPKTTTFAELLSKAGYSTGLVGKWHLGDKDQYYPTKSGYEYFTGFRGGGTNTKGPMIEDEQEVAQKKDGLCTDVLTDYALEFLKANKDKTFMLSLHYRAPHTKWLPVADADWAPYADLDPEIPNPDYPDLDIKRVKRMTCEYLASVSGVDRNLGRVLKTLDDLKLSDNTVVIFTSDHGYSMGHNGIWHKGNGHWVLTHPTKAIPNIPSNQRPNMYDNSLKVPTMVRWPGTIKPGTVIKQTVANIDWYPTLAAIGGAPLPENENIRGRSIVPLLQGKKVADWDNNFYAEYSTKHQSNTHMRMFRTPEWKLIRDFLNPQRDELYNLKTDPAETTNLIAKPEHKAIVKKLHAAIIKQMRKIKDPVLKTL